ncbi:MFS transporter [Lichenicoccus sp.]|uniref:MFS transporter n=1 Tax=Lichenicoccus sp. TaxID=2781899 RepID=UPI003D0D5CC9
MTMINYTDRVNLSVAAHAIAQRFHLSPAALGWLLSAHIWPYIICLAPAGLLIDRFGYRRGGAVSVGFWSFCTLATAIVTTPLALYVARVGLGAGEAANFPIGTRAIRAWAPRREYGFAISTLSLGQWFGTAFGAMTVGAVVQHFGWRGAFVFTGMLGLVWLVVWLLFIRDPQETRWLESEECAQILAEREVGSHASGDILQLLRSQSLWALGLAQGAFVYEAYMLLSWLPNFLQTQRGIAIFRSGLYTAIIYGTAVVVSILLARLSDRWLGQDALRHGARKWVVAASFLPAMLVAMIPAIGATWILVAALTVSVSFLANGIALNTALCNDLIRRPQDAGTAVALFTLISNLVGVTAPIVTGYVVGATGRFNGAFWLTGMILFAGVIVLLALVGGPIGAAERMERLA